MNSTPFNHNNISRELCQDIYYLKLSWVKDVLEKIDFFGTILDIVLKNYWENILKMGSLSKLRTTKCDLNIIKLI